MKQSDILAIDVGNTSIVFSVHDGKTWGEQLRVKTMNPHAVHEANEILKKLSFSRVVISSVVPNITGSIVMSVKKTSGIDPLVVSRDMETGLNRDSIPEEIGSDILCNLIAAHHEYPGEYVTVADFGTAFTTETVSPSGDVLGVTIGPGMMTSVKALYQNAAQIPEILLDIPTTVMGRNTEASVRAGVVYGFIGQLNAIVQQVEKEVGQKVIVVATGGFSRYLAGNITVNKADLYYTLEGERIAYDLNS